MKKKILFLVPLPPPLHGSSFINNEIYKSKAIKKNFSTVFLNSSPSKKFEEIEKFSFNKILNFIFILIKLIFNIIKFNPDLTYFCPSPRGIGFYKDLIVIFILKLFRTKLVFHLHGVGYNRLTRESKLKKKILVFFFKNVNLICLSKLAKHDIKNIFDPSKKIFILNNFAKTIPMKKKNKSILTFIFFSNLVPSKGIMVFLDSLKILQKKKTNRFKAKIIGDTFNEKFFKEFKDKLKKINNIKYLGPLYGKKKFAELSKSDVLVFPTKYKNENFPVVLLEAMAYGLPSVASDNGSIPEIIENNFNGIILKKNNANECAKCLQKYILNYKLLKRHSFNAKNKYKLNYTFQNFEKKLFKIFHKIN